MSDATRLILVIDTQIFLRAAINPRSLPARILFSFTHRYLLAVSKEIRDEIEDVLNRPKLRTKFTALTDERVQEIMAILDKGLEVHLDEIPAISRDPKDDIFLVTATEANADYLVSEDQDLLVLETYQGIRIINALELLHILENEN